MWWRIDFKSLKIRLNEGSAHRKVGSEILACTMTGYKEVYIDLSQIPVHDANHKVGIIFWKQIFPQGIGNDGKSKYT